MTLERRNPLPVGRYWIDVVSTKSEEFTGYLVAMGDRVHVEVTEAGEPLFYIFSVKTPIPWFPVNFGFPTVAPASIKSKADTVSRPDLPKDGADQIDDAIKSVAGSGSRLLEVGALIAGAILLSNLWSRSRGR